MKESYLRGAVDEYAKRLSAYCKFSVIEVQEERASLSPSEGEIVRIVQSEGKRIISKIPAGSYVYTMCIEGRQLSSEGLSEQLAGLQVNGKSSIAFIIGGSYGLSDEVKGLSDFRLSMSAMTFPHQLARVMLAEQLYRAFGIMNNSKYHK